MRKAVLTAVALTMVMTSFGSISAAPKQKAIVAVENASVYNFPDVLNASMKKLAYGHEINDLGGTRGWNTILVNGMTGYVKKTHTTLYTPIKEKAIIIRADKGYLFPIPNANSKARGSGKKGALLKAIGEYGKWYYVKSTDAEGKVWNGFISKTVAW